jgi:hypothetical protein
MPGRLEQAAMEPATAIRATSRMARSLDILLSLECARLRWEVPTLLPWLSAGSFLRIGEMFYPQIGPR